MDRESPREDAEAHGVGDEHEGDEKEQGGEDGEDERDFVEVGVERFHQGSLVDHLVDKRRLLDAGLDAVQAVFDHIFGLEGEVYGNGDRGLSEGVEEILAEEGGHLRGALLAGDQGGLIHELLCREGFLISNGHTVGHVGLEDHRDGDVLAEVIRNAAGVDKKESRDADQDQNQRYAYQHGYPCEGHTAPDYFIFSFAHITRNSP